MMMKGITIGSTNGDKADMTPLLVQVANKYASSIYLTRDDVKVNVKSIMGMLALSLKKKDVITVTAEGQDEEEALAAIERFLA